MEAIREAEVVAALYRIETKDFQGGSTLRLTDEQVVVCGAGGFIGGHLVKSLIDDGVEVIRAIDIKPVEEWYQVSSGVENVEADLKSIHNCESAVDGASIVFNLAADMGGMGFIENNKAFIAFADQLTGVNLAPEVKQAAEAY